MKPSIYYIDYPTDRVFPMPKGYASSSCKARCQTLSKHFFLPQQRPLNPCLAPVLWLLSWRHYRLPGKVEGHSCLSSFNHILHWSLLCTNICWNGESLQWQACLKDHCYTAAVGGTALSPGQGVLSSSLSSETRLQVTPGHYFTLLGFYFYTEPDCNKGVERTLST